MNNHNKSKEELLKELQEQICLLREENNSLKAEHEKGITERKQVEEELRERIKELNCLYAINGLIEKEDNLEKLLQGIADLIPNYWLHSEIACVRIIFEGRQYQSGNFRETDSRLSAELKYYGKSVGVIDLYYLEERPIRDEGPFLKEERNLINAIAEKLLRVTGRKRAEKELKQISARLTLATRAGGVGVWDYDVVNNILLWDDQMYGLYGINEKIFGGAFEAWQAGLHPDDRELSDAEVQMAIRGDKEFDTEFRVVWPDGTIRNIKALAVVQRDDSGNALRMIGTNWDITGQKQAEEALREALLKAEESDRLKTAFLNNISHEVRTPLNGILGFGQLLAEPDISAVDKARYLEVLNKSGYRLINTITDIMDISLIISGGMGVRKKTYNVKQLLEEIRLTFRKQCTEKNLSLSLHTPEENNEIHTDVELLRKILSHLLDNAVKFTDSGGITFGYTKNCHAELVDPQAGTPASNSLVESNSFRFFVRDTGVGIKPTVRNRIFDNFMQEEISSTRGHEGSGLGLSIARGLVELLGGEIGLESVKGEGSTFFFTIPSGITANKTVILIAEDDNTCSAYIKEILKDSSVELLSAKTGKEAVSFCRERSDISLILMDLKMPVMNGFEAAKRIKSFRKDLPIIAVTAHAETGAEHRALSAGCDDYITKPFNKDKLFAVIKKRIKC
jgi:signal transduction histidine kinase